MAQNKLTMRQIQEILRLKHQNQLSVREIARSCGLPTSTVDDYLKRAAAAGLSWPLPEGQSEAELLQRLLGSPAASSQGDPVLPDWPHLHKELARKSVTLQLLWQDTGRLNRRVMGIAASASSIGLGGHLGSGLRQTHLPGEKMFVDWAGQKVEIHSAQDGSVWPHTCLWRCWGPAIKLTPRLSRMNNWPLGLRLTATPTLFLGRCSRYGSR